MAFNKSLQRYCEEDGDVGGDGSGALEKNISSKWLSCESTETTRTRTFQTFMLQKLAPGKSFDHIKDVEVKKLVAKEFGRVARKLNEKRKEVSEMQDAEAKPIKLSKRSGHSYPQRRPMETRKWKRRIRYEKYRLNSCSNSAERRRTQANARNDHSLF